MDEHKFSGGTVTVLRENILLIEYNEIKTITVKNLYDLKELNTKLVGNRRYHTITELRNGLINLSDEAKKYVAESPKNKQRISDSLLVDSLAKRIEAELYLTFHKPKVKTKVFTDLNKALNWIEVQEHKNDFELV
jgi:uncharacterized membrane protein